MKRFITGFLVGCVAAALVVCVGGIVIFAVAYLAARIGTLPAAFMVLILLTGLSTGLLFWAADK